MDRLELGPVLGTGGFGEVRLATLSTPGGLQRLVAVKLIHPGAGDEDASLRRLRAEARLLASLDHPTVVAVEDLIEIDGRLALVMEYVPGADMVELLRAGDLPLRVAVEALSQVADALSCAWTEQGIVHRDIKPHNIRLGPNGRVKLLDFGIAHAREHTALTAEGLVAGSSGHMAPERFEADAQDTPASDVYALGCCLAAVLLNKPLWAGLNAHQQVGLAFDDERHDAALAKRLAPIEHAQLRGLLMQMLAWHHEDRPSAEVVAQALERAASTLPGPGLRAWSRARSWPEVSQVTETSGTLELPEPLPTVRAPRSRAPLALALAALAALGLAAAVVLGVGLSLVPPTTPSPRELSVAQQPAGALSAEPLSPGPLSPGPPAPGPKEDAEPPIAETPAAPPRPVLHPASQEPPPRATPPARVGPTVSVLLSTVPMGAPLSVDGRAIGPTPQTLELSVGTHTVTVVTASGDQSTTLSIEQEGDTRFIWKESAGAWTASR